MRLDSLWNNTEIYHLVTLLADGQEDSAREYYFRVQQEFENINKESSLSCLNWSYHEGNKIAKKLAGELEDWNDYIEYLKTFPENMLQAMYDMNLFDSYMAQNLP